ncbi:hypothetical protein DUI87_20444 [Hirundo rustica rustica]|uniref:Peptidase A2 domain-containing protein n=1 Tax=Hirundo rustica rustica TaxID=333673 RepID=A0A3M0JWS8_HIRRU|nr:hypothetical protein DUI87_20444 [Hirundo rustica rustica]
MLREYLSPVMASLAPAGGKPSPCPNKGESDGAAAEPTDITTVQVPAEPQGQPQPAAVASVETKKSKVKLANPGPSQYATFIATINAEDNRETVGSADNKLRNYESMINGPMEAHVSAVVKELKEEMKEMREETRRNSSHMAPEEAQENQVFWTVWSRWPGTSEPQKYEALVDTGSQCTLIPSGYVGIESTSIAGVTGGSQLLTLLEPKVSLTRKKWQKHPDVTGPGAPCILSIEFLQNGYYKDPKGLRGAFGIAAVEAEGIKKLNTLSGLLENPSGVGFLKVEEQQVPVHR